MNAGVPVGSEEIQALRRCVGDVVALSTLAAVWAAASPSQIAASLADVLHETVGADVVCVGLRAPGTAAAYHAVSRTPPAWNDLRDAIRADVVSWLKGQTSDTVDLAVRHPAHLVTPIGVAADYGVIVTVSRRPHFPSDIQKLLVNVAANQATLALVTGTAREEQRIAETLERIGRSVSAELHSDKVVQTVTDALTGLAGAEFGAFFTTVDSPSGPSYTLHTLSGGPREAFARFPMPRDIGVFAPTSGGAAIVRLADVTADRRFDVDPSADGTPGQLPVRSYLAVPVVSRTGKVHGGLFLGHQDLDVFTERHERLAIGLAGAAALAMDNGELYAEAQRANMAKDHFLATLSHELRTPLNAIVGWLSMLRRPEVMTTAGVPKAWAAIDRNTGALIGLIEDLLDVSRIATGKLRLAETEVDVNEVLRDGMRAMEPRFAEKELELTFDASPQPCIVRGDVARLRQVIMNLLANAVKFTPSGGQIAVTVTTEPTTVAFAVSDNGIGIHPDFLRYIFERFRQENTKSTTGLGLGLAIVKNLVELHGGTVTAASGGVGCGSRFTVTLPRLA